MFQQTFTNSSSATYNVPRFTASSSSTSQQQPLFMTTTSTTTQPLVVQPPKSQLVNSLTVPLNTGYGGAASTSQQITTHMTSAQQPSVSCHHHWVCSNCGLRQDCIQCKKPETKLNVYYEDEEKEEKYFEPVIINTALSGKQKSKTGYTPDRWRPRPIREMDLTIMVPPTKTLDDLLEDAKRDNEMTAVQQASTSASDTTTTATATATDTFLAASAPPLNSTATTTKKNSGTSSVDFLTPETSFLGGERMSIDTIPGQSSLPSEEDGSQTRQNLDMSFGHASMLHPNVTLIKKYLVTNDKPAVTLPANSTTITALSQANTNAEDELVLGSDAGLFANTGTFLKKLWEW